MYTVEYAIKGGIELLGSSQREVMECLDVVLGHDPLPFLLSAPGVSLEDGLVGWQVEDGRGRHWFHPAFYLYLKAATEFGGVVHLDSNESGKAEGNGKFYLKLKYGGNCGKFAIDRLVADAQPGERVREAADHHRHLPEELTKVSGRIEDGRPSKFKLGRAEAVQAALVQYDNRLMERLAMPISRHEYENMLKLLLLISDAQSARRVTPQGRVH